MKSIHRKTKIAFLTAAGILTLTACVHAAVITVDTASDVPAEPGCSLREALENTNSNRLLHQDCLAAGEPAPIVDEIHFAIPGPGVQTIKVQRVLPSIKDRVKIDGETQFDSVNNVRASCDPRNLLIELSGELLPKANFYESGIHFFWDGGIVRGLAINRFPDYGITIDANSPLERSYVIECNHVGTSADGRQALGNGESGIRVGTTSVSDILIGGAMPAQKNVISGNGDQNFTSSGIVVAGYKGRLRIIGNNIGTDLSGQAAVSNQTGIYILPQHGSLAIEKNVIAYNRKDGIYLFLTEYSAPPVSILKNSIFGNGELGIDLHPENVNLNDLGDVDHGPNDLLNFPDLLVAELYDDTLRVEFDFDVPVGKYRIDVFANSVSNSSGYGEGETFLGSADVTADSIPGLERHSVSISLPPEIDRDRVKNITATTTQLLSIGYGATSEFSETLNLSK